MDDLLNSALADASDAIVDLMLSEGQVVRTTLSPDGFGGQTSTETVIATVPCRWVRLTGTELIAADKVAPTSTIAVTVPAGTDVTRSDAVLVDGKRLEVIYVAAGTFKVQLRCLCSEVS